MNVLVIDGQGGQLGSQLIKTIVSELKQLRITAIGTNAVATAAMLKAGAHQAATGENPVIVASKKADVIIGPVGIVIADAMLGEITPAMAVAVGQADAKRILLPINKCENLIAGINDTNMSVLIEDVIQKLKDCMQVTYYNSDVSQLTPELQRATPILEVACGEMGVALACFTRSLHANQQVIGVGLKSNGNISENV